MILRQALAACGCVNYSTAHSSHFPILVKPKYARQVCCFQHCLALHVTCLAPHVTCLAPHVTCLAPHVTCLALHVTCLATCAAQKLHKGIPRSGNLLYIFSCEEDLPGAILVMHRSYNYVFLNGGLRGSSYNNLS